VDVPRSSVIGRFVLGRGQRGDGHSDARALRDPRTEE
jgi:hypothetical protein